MKLSFTDELRVVRAKGTHKAVRKFLKKRKLELRHVVSNKGHTYYQVLKKDDELPGGYKPITIKVPRRDEDAEG